MGGGISWGLLLLLAMLVFMGIGLGIAVFWESVNIYHDRRSLRLAVRKLDVARRAKKTEPDKPGFGFGVMDRELDG